MDWIVFPLLGVVFVLQFCHSAEQEPPTEIMIDVVGSRVSISWTSPVTTDILNGTDLKVYDKDNNLTYSATVNATTTTYAITTVQLNKCQLYTVKLSCQYRQLGWSKPIEVAFWPTDNRIYTTQATSVNVSFNASWTTPTDRSNFNVAFSKLSDSSTNDNIIHSDRILQNDDSKYSGLLQNGQYIQFTLKNFVKEDVGLYKSIDKLDSTLIYGCALLVVTEKPLKPKLAYDKYPFVGGNTSFKCSFPCKRSPSFVPCSWKCVLSLDNRKQANVLEMNPVTKADKGKNISCRVVDDKEEVSDSCDPFLLDPYYGPDDVRLSILGENATNGNTIGPITCTAVCYPKCNYKWQRFVSDTTTDVVIGQNHVIDGIYTCIITHQNDSSTVRTISMKINVQDSSTQSPTTSWLSNVNNSSTQSPTTSWLSNVNNSSTQSPTTSWLSNVNNSSTQSPTTSWLSNMNRESTIMYSAIAMVVLMLILITIYASRRLRKKKQLEHNMQQTQSPRDSISTIYHYIRDDTNLTIPMENPYLDVIDQP